MKVWEYLAAGKPVVSVNFPGLEYLRDVITLTDGREEFVSAVKAAFIDSGATERRKERARANTWTRRCEEIAKAAAPFFPKVSVIVLTYNQRELTAATLDSIRRFSRYPNMEVILVDNGSKDGTGAMVSAWAADQNFAKVILNRTNAGFAKGNNIGARASSGDYLVLLNNDVFVTDGWLSDLLAHFRANPRLGLLGPVTNASGNESVIDIEYADMEEMAIKARAYTRLRRGKRTPLAVSHFFCTMIPRPVWDCVGELDEGFGLGLFEDDDYAMRVRQAGFEIACAEDVFVHHHHSGSFASLPREEYERLFDHNRRYYESKWGPWTAPRYREELQAKGARSRERM